jgi:hypothetical protein
MEENINSAEELKTIRKMMEDSSRFLSLSGLSGVFAGAFAIAGALFAWFVILGRGETKYDEFFRSLSGLDTSSLRFLLFLDAIAVLFLSIAFALYFSARKAQKSGKPIWSPAAKRLVINMLIPLAAGGVFVLILLFQNNIQLIVPGLLIFYGLALVSAGKYTYSEIFWLGVLEIICGLAAAMLPGYGLLFWVFGFGLLHIIYGLLMYRKYEA